jgi:hypothetical protein
MEIEVFVSIEPEDEDMLAFNCKTDNDPGPFYNPVDATYLLHSANHF